MTASIAPQAYHISCHREPLVALFGAVLLTTFPCPPLAVAVQLVPHAYPAGQQPPPKPIAQLTHPEAQAPVIATEFRETPLPVGATIVRPLLLTKVALPSIGQE